MRVRFTGICAWALALVAAVLVSEIPLRASVVNVPEINAGSLSAGLGLLAAGVLVLRARRGK